MSVEKSDTKLTVEEAIIELFLDVKIRSTEEVCSCLLTNCDNGK